MKHRLVAVERAPDGTELYTPVTRPVAAGDLVHRTPLGVRHDLAILATALGASGTGVGYAIEEIPDAVDRAIRLVRR